MFHGTSGETLLATITESPSPLGIRTMARKTGLSKKCVRAVMRDFEKRGTVRRVSPSSVGSGKSVQTIFCLPDNKFYL